MYGQVVASANDSSSTTFFGINSSIGWSSNYTMSWNTKPYDRDGLAQLYTIGPVFGIRMGSWIVMQMGIKYSRLAMWDFDVDSSRYSSTGAVMYKDCRYDRTNLLPHIGLTVPVTIKKVIVTIGASLHRPILSRVRVEDFLTGTSSELGHDSTSRGIMSELFVSAGYKFGKYLNVDLGYSLAGVGDRSEFPSNSHASTGSSLYYRGKFHSVFMTVSLNIM
jgi:hypothetical protein